MPFWLHQPYVILRAKGFSLKDKSIALLIISSAIISLTIFCSYMPYRSLQRRYTFNQQEHINLRNQELMLKQQHASREVMLDLMKRYFCHLSSNYDKSKKIVNHMLEIMRHCGMSYHTLKHYPPENYAMCKKYKIEIKARGKFDQIYTCLSEFEKFKNIITFDTCILQKKMHGDISITVRFYVISYHELQT